MDFKINRKILTFVVVFLQGIFAGLFLAKAITPKPELLSEKNEVRFKTEYPYISQLIDCNSSPSDNAEILQLKTKTKRLVNKFISQNRAADISVYFRDLNNGPWFGINEKDTFNPASISKVFIMMAVLQKAETDPEFLNKLLKYRSDLNPVHQDIKSPPTLELDQNYSVEQLTQIMIVESDNRAADVLEEQLDENHIKNIYSDLGIQISSGTIDPYFCSIKEISAVFRVLYNASYLNQEMSNTALEILTNAEFDRGIAAGIPNNIPIANKFGEMIYPDLSERQLHDCGIVYLPDSPYLLCIMSRGSNFDILAENIQQISILVYSHLANNGN